jgi:hypothetical protein
MNLRLKTTILAVGVPVLLSLVSAGYFLSRGQSTASAQVGGLVLAPFPTGDRVQASPNAEFPTGQAVDVPFTARFVRGQNVPVQLSRTAALLLTDRENADYRQVDAPSTISMTAQQAIDAADSAIQGELVVAPTKTTADYVTFFDPMSQQRREAWRVVYWGSPILQMHTSIPGPGGTNIPVRQSTSRLAVTIVLIDPRNPTANDGYISIHSST